MTRPPVPIVNKTKRALPISRLAFRKANSLFTGSLTPHPGSLEDEIDVHQYIPYTSFATSPSVNTQSVSLSPQPAETRAARSEVTNPAVLVGELDAIVERHFRVLRSPPTYPRNLRNRELHRVDMRS